MSVVLRLIPFLFRDSCTECGQASG